MGDMVEWFVENWFDLFTSVGVIGGLFFTAHSVRSETKMRRISNLLAMTSSHREVWKEVIRYPALARVTDPAADISGQPVTPAEESFMNLVISHTGSMYEALKSELVIKQEGLRRDVGLFFSLPIPNAVWSKTRLLQNQDFAAFIDSSLKQP